MEAILTDGVGYLALIINLYSMSSKGEHKLRVAAVVANVIYIFYGILIHAIPVVVGCIIAVILHTHNIRRLRIEKNYQ